MVLAAVNYVGGVCVFASVEMVADGRWGALKLTSHVIAAKLQTLESLAWFGPSD